MFNIVLHEPRMPGNVTIGRLAFAFKLYLHLSNLGFGELLKKK